MERSTGSVNSVAYVYTVSRPICIQHVNKWLHSNVLGVTTHESINICQSIIYSSFKFIIYLSLKNKTLFVSTFIIYQVVIYP